MAHRPGWAFRPRRALAALLLGAFALLVSEAPAEAGNAGGTAKYKYVVLASSSYTGSGQIGATRGTILCSPGFTAYWSGGVTSEPVELSPLLVGKGSLKIGPKGTSGQIAAQIPDVFSFNAVHILVVGCTMGSPSASTTTPCATQREAGASVIAQISGGKGSRVQISWSVSTPSFVFGPVPDFTCVEQFRFPQASQGCKSHADLSQFTRKIVTLPFACQGQDLSVPASLDTYEASSEASGFLALKRKAPKKKKKGKGK